MYRGQFRTGAQNIINYDFATAFANIVRADLQQQATNAQNQFNAVLNTELTFWRSPAGMPYRAPLLCQEMC